MSALDDLLASEPLPASRRLAWGGIAAFALFIVWACFAELDQTAIATGEVVPQGKVRTVQHFEGGIIAEIYVEEGARVAAGDALLQLDVSASHASREETQVKLDALSLSLARLRAEAEGKPLRFSDEAAASRPDLVAAERRTFDAWQAQLASSMDSLRAGVRQREAEIAQLHQKDRALVADLKLAREKLAMSDSLRKEELTSKLDHLAVQTEVAAKESELENVRLSIPRAEAALAEAQSHLKEGDAKFRREAQDEANRIEPQIVATREQLGVSTDQVRRTKIVSPIDGVVKDLRYHTVGGVVRPGEPIMQIVPTDERLVIESKLSPTDRGYVRTGQKAQVKISAFDFYQYGALDGTVTHISPDSTVTQDGKAYFTVVVETDRAWLGTETDKLPITPGMQATVDIHTGTRSVIRYLLKPVLRLRYEGFRER